MVNKIKEHISESISVKNSIYDDNIIIGSIAEIAECITVALTSGSKVLIAGNGGSAADAQHIAGEFVSRFYFDRPALSAIALTTDTSIITAIGNDYDYEQVFSRQIYANAQESDIFIAISTSGNSPSIINAIDAAKEKRVKVVGLTGKNDSKMNDRCDYIIKVPSCSTPRIQEAHIMIAHIICGLVEENIFGGN